MGAADYIELVAARARIIAAVARRTAGFDAVICPTCPVIPPAIAEVEEEAEYNRINLLLLRNTAVANFLDRCSISLPIHRRRRGAGRADADRRVHGGQGAAGRGGGHRGDPGRGVAERG